MKQSASVQWDRNQYLGAAQQCGAGARHVRRENPRQFRSVGMLQWQDQTPTLRVVGQCPARLPIERRIILAGLADGAERSDFESDATALATGLADEAGRGKTGGAQLPCRGDSLLAGRAMRR